MGSNLGRSPMAAEDRLRRIQQEFCATYSVPSTHLSRILQTQEEALNRPVFIEINDGEAHLLRDCWQAYVRAGTLCILSSQFKTC